MSNSTKMMVTVFSFCCISALPVLSQINYQISSASRVELNVFNSIREACNGTGISVSTIGRSINGYKRLGRGFYWIKK